MATRLIERIPVDRIQAEARPVDLGRLLMVAIVGVFYALGFVVAKTVIGLGVALGWVWAAAKTGWQDAHKPAEERRRVRAA